MKSGPRGVLLLLALATALRLLWPLADPADLLSWSTGIYTDPPANALPARHAVEHDDWSRVAIAARLFYPLLNGLAYAAFFLAGVGRWPLQVLAALVGVATVAILAGALRRRTPGALAWTAPLFLACAYWLVMFSRVLMAEGVAALLLAVATATALERGPRAGAVSGAAATAAVLFGKFHAAGFLPALFVFLWLRAGRVSACGPAVLGGTAVTVVWLAGVFLPHRAEILGWIRESPVRGTGVPPALRTPVDAGLELFKTYRTAWLFHRLPVLATLGGFFALWTLSGRDVLRRRLENGTALFAFWLLSMFAYCWLLPYTAPRYFVLLVIPLLLCAAAQVARWLDGEGITPMRGRRPGEVAAVGAWAVLFAFGAVDALAHYRFWLSGPSVEQLIAGTPPVHGFASVTQFSDRGRFVAQGLLLAPVVLVSTAVAAGAMRRRYGVGPAGPVALRRIGRFAVALALAVNLGQWFWWASHRHDFIDRTIDSLDAILGPGAVALGPFAPLLTLGTTVDAVPFFGTGLDPTTLERHRVTHVLVAPPGGVESLETHVPGITGRLEMVHWWPLRTTTVKKLELYRLRGTDYEPSRFEAAIAAVRERDWARGQTLLSRYRADGGRETAELLLYESHCRFGLGDAAEAERLLRRAITLRPDNSILYMNLGILARRRGDREAARAHWLRGLELDPSNGQLRRMLSESGTPLDAGS